MTGRILVAWWLATAALLAGQIVVGLLVDQALAFMLFGLPLFVAVFFGLLFIDLYRETRSWR